MMKVIILVCAASVARADCDADTALYLMNGPKPGNQVMCGLQSQAYLAQTWIGRSLAEGEYLKIVCQRSPRLRDLEKATARP